jgi:mannose-6-phosphate isomerase-like protein (cupin superfamily)
MEVINRNTVATLVGPNGDIIRELAASRNSSARKQSLAEATIPVGGTVPEHFHKTIEELYFVLSGTGLMKIEDETRQIGEGDTVIILPGQRHKITNNGSEPLVFLACCSPEWNADDQVVLE